MQSTDDRCAEMTAHVGALRVIRRDAVPTRALAAVRFHESIAGPVRARVVDAALKRAVAQPAACGTLTIAVPR